MKKLQTIICLLLLIGNTLLAKEKTISGNTKKIELNQEETFQVKKAIELQKEPSFSFITIYGERILNSNQEINTLTENQQSIYYPKEEDKAKENSSISLKEGDHLIITIKRVQKNSVANDSEMPYTFSIILKSTNDDKQYKIDMPSFQNIMMVSTEIAQPICNCDCN